MRIKKYLFDETLYYRSGEMQITTPDNKELIASVHGDLEAARLIAAAPEMLEALQVAERCLAVAIHAGAFAGCAAPKVGEAALARVSHALAKARGEL